MENISVDYLILVCKVITLEYGLHKKIMSDAGCSFISENSENSSKEWKMEQAASSYHHQSNGHMGACINFLK